MSLHCMFEFNDDLARDKVVVYLSCPKNDLAKAEQLTK